MFGCAIAWGPWSETAGKPCHGIARYRRPPGGRVLGAENLAEFGAGVCRVEAGSPLRVAAVRPGPWQTRGFMTATSTPRTRS